ncbi:hypothetical protein N4T77_05520 [Clostridium sp. CX1]|uniref:hypothetical protein n=1 Tax=Clostridium sp. CX1 TaxID=2978346 RepID=UPI0021BE43E9|nr:hypothetical protein [Clostridium sp. CX1]MCT8976052.1 hypothetical protein [Clostridium sp. CX1]
MKTFIKTTFFITFFLMSLVLTACSEKESETSMVVDIPRYSKVTAIENLDSSANVFKIENRGLYKIGVVEDLNEMVYSIKNSVYAYSVNKSKGENFNNNSIIIIKDGKKKELKGFYSALDLRLSPSGDKLAYRTFKKDSLDSAEGLKIYNIKDKKQMVLNSKVMVSGNLYWWLDSDRIMYYGAVEGKKNSDNIYVYDFTKNKEEIYLEDTKGYCMFLTSINNSVFFLGREGDESRIYYYNIQSKETRSIDSNVEEIYKATADLESGDIFFLGAEEDRQLALYRFSSKSLKIDRLTYDFPKRLDLQSELALDDQGNIYFSGIENEEVQDKKDVFMYDKKERAINLISTHEGKYNVYSSDRW